MTTLDIHEPADGGDVPGLYVGGTFEGYAQVLAGIGVSTGRPCCGIRGEQARC